MTRTLVIFSMKFHNKIIHLLILTLFSNLSISQPRWAKEKASSESGDFDYFYGEGTTRRDAYFDALEALASKRGLVDADFTIEKKTKILNETSRESKTEIGSEVKVSGKNLFVFEVDEVRAKGRFYILIGSPKPNLGSMYGGFMPRKNFVWRSALAPGWGQFYNRESSKGMLFSLGEVGLIAGTIFSFSQASNHKQNADNALLQGNLAQFTRYDQKRNNLRTTGTILGVSAAALWILNIIDATASRKNLYVRNEHKSQVRFIAQGNQIGLKYSF